MLRSPSRPPASTPTRRSASAARRAKSPASSGTSSPADGFDWTGNSYDNTAELSATSWRHVKFIEQFPTRRPARARPAASPADGASRWTSCSNASRRRPLADDERRLQALRRGPLPAGVPDRRHHPQRVRERLHPARHLQRLLVLRRGLPVRRHHPQRLRRPFAQVHALLRPPEGRPGPGLRQGLPDRSRSSSARSTSCASGPASGSRSFTRAASRKRTSTATSPPRPTPSCIRSTCWSIVPPSTACRKTPFNPWLHMIGRLRP